MGLGLVAVATTFVAVVLGGAQAASRPYKSDSVRAWNAHAAAALFNATNAPIPGAGQTPPLGRSTWR